LHFRRTRVYRFAPVLVDDLRLAVLRDTHLALYRLRRLQLQPELTKRLTFLTSRNVSKAGADCKGGKKKIRRMP
jgi:hypothetical protein